MKIAIPVAEGKLSMHFGHVEEFALFDVDVENKKVLAKQAGTPPSHEPGSLPRWLNASGVNLLICGGIGPRATGFLNQMGIEVILGAASDDPETVVKAYLDGTLEAGENICDH